MQQHHPHNNIVLRFFGFIIWYGYATAVLGWYLLHTLYADTWGWLFMLNTFAVYLIVPLPLWGIRPFFTKHKLEWLIWAGIIWILLSQFGALFTPKLATAPPTSQTLTVVTYNLLISNNNLDGIEQALRETDADVIAFQELSLNQAAMIRSRLQDLYPYQLLSPERTVVGLGIISRYPLEQLPLPTYLYNQDWVGGPQIARVQLGDTAVHIINFHAIPLGLSIDGQPTGFAFPNERHTRLREKQARALARYARETAVPTIALGDLNATDQSLAYEIITRYYQDAWRTAGWGFGNSWPGFQLQYEELSLPRWLVRIDHIFATPEWTVISSNRAPWDGGSDHHPVLATLSLKQEIGDSGLISNPQSPISTPPLPQTASVALPCPVTARPCHDYRMWQG